ncbi:tuftelin-interacting protein 11 [Eurytemora carolleeae]|uniref:tuftelin-interacting protein 11 n=1 Tax=Eurytemora carolleeae TaxID=1294199 RepID=UPI000C777EDA|nr:tuftelin-interacting protein 11 [Eurytemora carolleeae]|eukprot:XP_023335481.1 tuftelin-interacting protein 11-like [Eurytemora affinis]
MDDEVMRFEITDQDLEDEMTSSYGKKRTSKNKQIYGVWADKSDSEEDEGPSIGSYAGTKRGKKVDYTASMNFVSAGIAGKEKKKEGDEEDEEGGEEMRARGIESGGDSSDDDRPRFGGSGRGGGSMFTPRAAGRMEDAGQIAGMRTQNFFQPQSLGKGFGDWEKHTKGIGAKLLLKMGYKAGGGLGKNLEGRAQIVEAFVRKGKGAIGRYGPEGSRPKTGKADSEDEEEAEFKSKLRQWKTVNEVGGKKRTAEYVYKSVEEVLEEGKFRKIKRDDQKTSTVKVIDMTGREERVLTGYQSISGQQRPDEDGFSSKHHLSSQGKKKRNFELPELIHNLNLLVDMCEQDIIQADRQLVHHKDRVSLLDSEGEKLSILVDREKDQIESLEQIIAVIDRLEQKFVDGTLDMELALKAFQRLKDEFQKEFREFELQYVASTIVVPLVKSSLLGWTPLAGKNESIPHLTTFTQWRDILEEESNQFILQPGPSEPMPAYHTLLWEAWIPTVRLAVQRWQSRQPDSLIGFLELWRPLLPNWILQYILDQMVLIRLQAEVEMWNPLTDTTPIHTWIHPWLPPLGNKLDIVYPTIRNKLASALANWHPADRSARSILAPWAEVFTKGSMNAFLLNNIIPKLEAALLHLPINPINQDLTLWHAVVDWTGLVPPAALADIIAVNFFPRWLQVLAAWLNSNPNYTEVTAWYQGWKGVIPTPILAHPRVVEHIQQALHMMNRSVVGGPMSQQPGALENVKYLTTREFETNRLKPAGLDVGNKNKFDSISEAVKTSSQIPQGFKDMIARRCEERGTIFRPVPGRLREGKQIYLVGRQHCYLDRNVIFVQDDTRWVPTSLNSLIDNA